MAAMKKVLVVNGQYVPGYKGGGPIQSCVNMVENLADQYDFYILCADRDYKEEKPYLSVKVNKWNQVGAAKVYYLSPEKQGLAGFKKILNEIEYDVMYLNGFFSPIFTIRPLLLRRFGSLKNKSAKIILTPRGDFTGGCENKKLKKYSYIYFVKMIGLYKKILWHATSGIEEKDIKTKFPKADVFTVSNFPEKFVPKKSILQKKSGELNLVFISRIFPKKNIKYALEVLKQITEGTVVFDIYGPMEDKAYWGECEELIHQMPSNIKVKYCGEAEHKNIPYIFGQYHAFFFPTLGENYGHVIVEAMMNNCLCILSKGVTPWDDYIEALDIGAALEQQDKFVEIISRIIRMNCDEIQECIKYTSKYILEKTNPEDIIRDYNTMLGKKISNSDNFKRKRLIK